MSRDEPLFRGLDRQGGLRGTGTGERRARQRSSCARGRDGGSRGQGWPSSETGQYRPSRKQRSTLRPKCGRPLRPRSRHPRRRRRQPPPPPSALNPRPPPRPRASSQYAPAPASAPAPCTHLHPRLAPQAPPATPNASITGHRRHPQRLNHRAAAPSAAPPPRYAPAPATPHRLRHNLLLPSPRFRLPRLRRPAKPLVVPDCVRCGRRLGDEKGALPVAVRRLLVGQWHRIPVRFAGPGLGGQGSRERTCWGSSMFATHRWRRPPPPTPPSRPPIRPLRSRRPHRPGRMHPPPPEPMPHPQPPAQAAPPVQPTAPPAAQAPPPPAPQPAPAQVPRSRAATHPLHPPQPPVPPPSPPPPPSPVRRGPRARRPSRAVSSSAPAPRVTR